MVNSTTGIPERCSGSINNDIMNELTSWCIRNKIHILEQDILEKLFIRAIKGSKDDLYDTRNNNKKFL